MTPVKLAFGGAAIFALMAVFAIQRLPGETIPVKEAESHFDAAWADSFQTAVLKKSDLEKVAAISDEPRPVKTERVLTDVPASAPPVVQLREEERPAAKQRRHAAVDQDVCTRHKMHKVYTHGGKSWRCKR